MEAWLKFFCFFVVLFIKCFRLDAHCTYSCIGTSGKIIVQKPLQRVFNWVPFSLESSPIYSLHLCMDSFFFLASLIPLAF